MYAFVIRRIASAALTLGLVLVVIFLVFQVLGDPGRLVLPLNATQQEIERYNTAHGYNDPIFEQFWRFFSGAIRLDFGTSTSTGGDAMSAVLDALPYSLALAGVAFTITTVLGLTMGTIAGLNEDGMVDRLIQIVGSVASAIPEFWSGLILIIVLAVTFPLFPTGGSGGPEYLILPAIAMSIPPIGRLLYVVRGSVRSSIHEPFALVARSKGLSSHTYVFSHVLRASMIPILSISGLELTRMAIGGVVVIESVFAWPGMGRLFVQAMTKYDLALVSATLFTATAIVLCMNLILDLAYAMLDPRIKASLTRPRSLVAG